MEQFSVIIPAAGTSSRFGGGQNKLLQPLGGVTVLVRTLGAFASRTDVGQVILATALEAEVWSALPEAQRSKIIQCAGGSSRAQSVQRGLRQVPLSVQWVAIHDAARPLISQELIDRVFQEGIRRGAAVPALPVTLTVKQADGPLPARVRQTIPRHRLWAMQTPQVMGRKALLDAFETSSLPLDEITDDAQLIELAGGEVWLVAGEERNLKITTAQDLLLAETLLQGG